MPYSEHKAKHIYRFFQKQLSEGHAPFWARGTSITLEKTGSTLVLENDVVARRRKAEKPDEPRFEFVGAELRKDLQGTRDVVSLIDQTLKNDAFRQTGADGRARMIKYLAGGERRARLEARNTALVKNLHAKYVENTPKGAALIMDRMPGVRLFDIVEPDQTGHRPLDGMSMIQRRALTLALLQAFKEQVSVNGLIHLDIKPENIMVDLSSSPFTVNFIDFGLSILSSERLERSVGTQIFVSPEVMQQNFAKVSSKTDNFSLAKVIAQIWGSSSLSFGATPFDVWERIHRNHNLEGLFAGIEEKLSENDRGEIRAILAMALHPLADRRSSVETIIHGFERLDLSYTEQAIALCPPSSSDEESASDSSFDPIFFASEPARTAEDENLLNVGCCSVL
ncbi:protein kinase domain-containing protein [Legionella sp. CNM-4043-24]|uniref:protein kinase domain-containing protein n=1 Tax=Legionella sp. CNM-4043-24 TaxID=3421646 RepID=UPI00403AB522